MRCECAWRGAARSCVCFSLCFLMFVAVRSLSDNERAAAQLSWLSESVCVCGRIDRHHHLSPFIVIVRPSLRFCHLSVMHSICAVCVCVCALGLARAPDRETKRQTSSMLFMLLSCGVVLLGWVPSLPGVPSQPTLTRNATHVSISARPVRVFLVGVYVVVDVLWCDHPCVVSCMCVLMCECVRGHMSGAVSGWLAGWPHRPSIHPSTGSVSVSLCRSFNALHPSCGTPWCVVLSACVCRVVWCDHPCVCVPLPVCLCVWCCVMSTDIHLRVCVCRLKPWTILSEVTHKPHTHTPRQAHRQTDVEIPASLPSVG